MVKMPFLTTDTPADIITPSSPLSDTQSVNSEFKEFLDGSKISSDVFTEMKSGIWWWCIIHNNITTSNVDVVYTTPTVYFELEEFMLGLANFTDQYFSDEVPKVKLITDKGIKKALYLSNPNTPEPNFAANLNTFVLMDNLKLEEVDVYNIPDPNSIYAICSFRRLLDPVHEYLEHKSTIDAVHVQDIKDDLLFSLKILDKNSKIGATLAQRIADIQTHIEILTMIKERAATSVFIDITDRPTILRNLESKIEELVISLIKLQELKRRYDELN